MSDRRPPRPPLSRLPLVISLLALVVALSGTAVAAGLAKNSVGTKQLKRAAVATAKIKQSAVTTAKIKRGAVASPQIRDGSVTGRDLAAGVLPPASVSIHRIVEPGEAMAPVTVAGLRLEPYCRSLTNPTRVQAQVLVTSVGEGGVGYTLTMHAGGDAVRLVADGADLLPIAVTYTDEPSAKVVVSEGIVSAGSGPWVRLSVGLRALQRCQVHLAATPVR